MSSQSSSNMSRSTSGANQCLDPLDSLIDFTGGEYETMSYQSPSISPSTSSKGSYIRPVASTPTANNAMLTSSEQTLSGPSHNYDMYKQQTGIPSGAIGATLAMNQNRNTVYGGYNYMSGLSPVEDFNDFNGVPSQSFSGLDMDIEYDSPSTEPAFFYPEQSMSGFVDPSNIQDSRAMPAAAVLPTQTSNVGRLWPGMHQQQAAIAKAQQQQKQQQQLIQQQRQQNMAQQPRQQQRPKQQAADPIVEEKISQLLNSMRQGSVTTSEGDENGMNQGMSHAHRMRKEEEDMDEDERLLASEEGKKLSSKERRQLRNKVSARAFRSRRKEYIGQLEGEIAGKVNECNDLRSQNRALMEENTRLSDLTRMLLSSPSFSGFLDTLSTAPAPIAPQPQQAPVEQRPVQNRQIPKDVNPYLPQQKQNMQMNLALLPEHNMDFSMLDLNTDGGFSYQPQVFSVLSMPEVPFDTSILSGKSSNLAGSFEEEKVEMPIIERMPVFEEETVEATPIVNDEFDADPAFALFSSAVVAPVQAAPVFQGVESEKTLHVVDAAKSAASETAAMMRFERLCSKLDDCAARLAALTVGY